MIPFLSVLSFPECPINRIVQSLRLLLSLSKMYLRFILLLLLHTSGEYYYICEYTMVPWFVSIQVVDGHMGGAQFGEIMYKDA